MRLTYDEKLSIARIIRDGCIQMIEDIAYVVGEDGINEKEDAELWNDIYAISITGFNYKHVVDELVKKGE